MPTAEKITSAIEREEFSQRLKQALRNAEFDEDSPTQLQRQFNAQWNGDRITVHAVRKWLVGEAIPTQEKLRALAKMLGVSAEWLRFGDTEMAATKPNGALPSADVLLFDAFRRLDAKTQQAVRDFIRTMAVASRS
jgi:hypothetical protein